MEPRSLLHEFFVQFGVFFFLLRVELFFGEVFIFSFSGLMLICEKFWLFVGWMLSPFKKKSKKSFGCGIVLEPVGESGVQVRGRLFPITVK